MARRNKSDSEKYFSPFASNTRKLMDERGITQDELAKKVGKTRQTVSQYVNGISEPGYDTLIKIAKFFDVTTDYLLGLTTVSQDNYDIRKVNEYTGLSPKAIFELGAMKALNDSNAEIDVLSLLLESSEFRYIIGLLSVVISEKIQKEPISTTEFDFRTIPNDKLYTSVMNIYMTEMAERIAVRFEERYHESPQNRRLKWEESMREAYKKKDTQIPSGTEMVERMRAYNEVAERRKKEVSHGID